MFHLRTGTGPARAAAPKMTAVEFITYREDLTGSVACGPLKSPAPVYLTWRAGTNAEEKVAVAVEFLPTDK